MCLFWFYRQTCWYGGLCWSGWSWGQSKAADRRGRVSFRAFLRVCVCVKQPRYSCVWYITRKWYPSTFTLCPSVVMRSFGSRCSFIWQDICLILNSPSFPSLQLWTGEVLHSVILLWGLPWHPGTSQRSHLSKRPPSIVQQGQEKPHGEIMLSNSCTPPIQNLHPDITEPLPSISVTIIETSSVSRYLKQSWIHMLDFCYRSITTYTVATCTSTPLASASPSPSVVLGVLQWVAASHSFDVTPRSTNHLPHTTSRYVRWGQRCAGWNFTARPEWV